MYVSAASQSDDNATAQDHSDEDVAMNRSDNDAAVNRSDNDVAVNRSDINASQDYSEDDAAVNHSDDAAMNIHLEKHTQSHETAALKAGSVICDICKESCETRKDLRSHIQKEHRVKTATQDKTHKGFACQLCDNTFSRRGQLAKHMRNHEEGTTQTEHPYMCEICKNSYKTLKGLKRHLNVSHADLSATAYQKQISTVQQKQRARHAAYDVQVNPDGLYACLLCKDKSFEYKTYLHEHLNIRHFPMRKTAVEAPHECSVCKKMFVQVSQLEAHMTTHTGLSSWHMKRFPFMTGFAQNISLYVWQRLNKFCGHYDMGFLIE